MKAIIVAEPKFHLTLNDEVITILLKLSEQHYDSTCKSASKEGGFLIGWQTSMKYRDGKFTSDFHNLDLSLKIAENFMNTLSEDESKIIRDYCEFIISLFVASEKFSEHDINIEA
jgi:hypothetical protein